METNRIHGKPLIYSLAAFLVIETGASLIFKEQTAPLQVVACLRILEIAAWCGIFWMHDKHLKNLGIDPGRLKTGLVRGLLWSAGFGALAFLSAVVIRMAGHDPIALVRIRMPASGGQIAILFLVAGLIGPIAEEVFFRGILYGYLRRWGATLAILVVTFLFAAVHSQISPVQVIGGIVFAVAYEIEGDLTVPIVIHTTGNTALYMISLLL